MQKLMPAGRYWIGDLCYMQVSHEDRIESGHMLCTYTKYGDGVYFDQFGNEYGVDSGTLGAVDADVAESGSLRDLGSFFNFAEDTVMTYDEDTGQFTFGFVVIDTGH